MGDHVTSQAKNSLVGRVSVWFDGLGIFRAYKKPLHDGIELGEVLYRDRLILGEISNQKR